MPTATAAEEEERPVGATSLELARVVSQLAFALALALLTAAGSAAVRAATSEDSESAGESFLERGAGEVEDMHNTLRISTVFLSLRRRSCTCCSCCASVDSAVAVSSFSRSSNDSSVS